MSTLVDVLHRRSHDQPNASGFVFLDEAETEVSYADLDLAARMIAAALSDRGAAGKPVLLLYPPGRAYVEGFLGCLYAGAIAVPAYPPDPRRLERTLPRLRGLVVDCGATLALSVSGLADAAASLADTAPELARLDWIATDTLPPEAADSWRRPALDPGSIALLQYTSGSTATPRGVMVSHQNLAHNAELVRTGFQASVESVGMSWLPPYHDMGLIGGIVQPIHTGFPILLMSPLTFLQRPLSWLEAASRHGVTITGGPNFGFDLCVRKSTPEQRADLDLSRWSVAFTGAEPVRPETLGRFSEAFAPAGFRRNAFYPCYGLAEGTLIATGGRAGAAPRLIADTDGKRHVGCGVVLGDQTVAVVDSGQVACPAGVEGEIWLSGPSVAAGYWNRPEQTAEIFGARLAGELDRRYLRTGDLGFLDPDGELVVTGRAKDLIVIRGRNVYPQDLEHLLESEIAGLRPGCVAAFSVERGDEERVVIAAEASAQFEPGALAEETIAAIRHAVAASHDIAVEAVVLLRAGTIPKTSSGKIQRHACRDAFTAGELTPQAPGVIAAWDWADGSTAGARQAAATAGAADPASGVGPAGAAPGETDVIATLRRCVGSALGLAPHAVPATEPLTRLGLDSLRAVEVRHALESELGLRVALSDLLTGVTLAELASHATKPDAAKPS
ncbi:MAG: AMP-binding protein, partial [Micromonosporaceae bacterium]